MSIKKLDNPLVIRGSGAYPLTTSDQIIKKDGSRLETENGISVDHAINADNAVNAEMLAGQSPGYYVSHNEMNNKLDITLTDYAPKSFLGGLKFQKITQENYDTLSTKDSSTLYIIVG